MAGCAVSTESYRDNSYFWARIAIPAGQLLEKI